MTNNAMRSCAALIALTSVFLLLTGCSIPFADGPATGDADPNRTNQDIPEGPGLLTGKQGALEFGRDTGKDKKAGETPAAPTQAQAERLEEQAKEFDRQIEELERQRRELETLTEELKEILKSSPRAQ